MATPRRFTYTVTTSLTPTVPFDMLRYDCAWPASQDDAANLGLVNASIPRAERPTSFRLASHQAPTVARWASFGWHVSNINEQRF